MDVDLWWLRPDEKSQGMMEYVQPDISVETRNIHTIVIPIQHAEPLQTVCSFEVVGYSGTVETALSMEEMN